MAVERISVEPVWRTPAFVGYDQPFATAGSNFREGSAAAISKRPHARQLLARLGLLHFGSPSSTRPDRRLRIQLAGKGDPAQFFS